MKEAQGNLWDLVRGNAALVITTNGAIRRDGSAVMGRGIALEALSRHPGIQHRLGGLLEDKGNHVFVLGFYPPGYEILSFPVKHHWREEADPELIIRSAHELVTITNRMGWGTVWMPRPGCGNGRLDWSDVKPLLEPILDDRFIAVTK